MSTTTPAADFHQIKADKPADLLKNSITVVWLFLIIATVISWAMGTDHTFIDDHEVNSISILVIAFIKIRFIGMYFMELKDAPLALKSLMDLWCLVVCLLCIGFYLAA